MHFELRKVLLVSSLKSMTYLYAFVELKSVELAAPKTWVLPQWAFQEVETAANHLPRRSSNI